MFHTEKRSDSRCGTLLFFKWNLTNHLKNNNNLFFYSYFLLVSVDNTKNGIFLFD